MKRNRSQRFLTSLLVVAVAMFGWMGAAKGASLSEVLSAAEEINAQARQSQARIDSLSEETRRLLNQYRTVLKEIEGLQVYNRQLERQIGNQEREKTQLEESIEEVTVIERQIMPLMMRMIDGLEQFVELDVPFLQDERRDRIERLRELMDRADVSPSDQFSQIFNAYQIENEYGRTMEAYTDRINVNGTERVVDILRVGRVVLAYQTSDGAETGAWNVAEQRWERLPDRYRTPINNGIRMARQQMSVDLLTLPVPGAEDN
jgi:predicted RNase H-like nuclease (RuvC/YqgF family)